MVPRVKDNNPLARKRSFHWISMKSRLARAARETSKFQNWTHLTTCRRRYKAEILPRRRKTLSNQSINVMKKVQKQKKACKMEKNDLINMTIPGAHLQLVSNQCTNFQKNPCTHFSEHAWTKSCPQTGDWQTEDRVKPIYPPNFVCVGYKKKLFW